jgi:hypothetical protein
MYRIVAYYYADNLGGFRGPVEVYRDARRHVCERYCQRLRKLARLGPGPREAVYFVRHVRHTSRPTR